MNIELPTNIKALKQTFLFEGQSPSIAFSNVKETFTKEIKGWKMNISALKQHLNDPLYKNSFFSSGF